jgi:hypothetical protein
MKREVAVEEVIVPDTSQVRSSDKGFQKGIWIFPEDSDIQGKVLCDNHL